MDDETTTLHNITSIKEMILDEEKLVTYTSVSKDLCIHVNVCKTLLNAVVEDITKKQPNIELNINYIISGLCDSTKARTTVCSKSDVQSVRKTFHMIFFEHIYSVSKGVPRVDNLALMMINKFEDFSLCVGLIKSSSCIKMTTNEIVSFKTNHQDIEVTKPLTSKNANVTKIKEEEHRVSNNQQPKKSKSMPTIKKELSPSKDSLLCSKPKLDMKPKSQKGIAGFFNKQTSDKKTVQNPKETIKSITKGEIVNKNNSVKVEIMEIDEQKKEPKFNSKETFNKTTKVKSEEMEIDENKQVKSKLNSKEIITNNVKTESATSDLSSKDYKNKNKPKNKSLKDIKKNAHVDKKRKRVLLVSDSESDEDKDPFADDLPIDVENNQEPEDEIPPTPTINTVKITSGIMNPKKRRKIVDKTYTDDEGYILTKKVEVYESCSDNEEEIDKKENIQNSNHVKKEYSDKNQKSPKEMKKQSKTKKISPQSGKQATLMNFFKKV